MSRIPKSLRTATLWAQAQEILIHAALYGICSIALGQGIQPTILQIDTANQVQYFEDTSDLSKLASNPGITPATLPKNYTNSVTIGDIVAVNGQPAKGTLLFTLRMATLRTAPNPGEAIADVVRNSSIDMKFEILQTDGTPVGTIMIAGFGAGSPPPGSPLDVVQGNNAITGGTGAFLGVRGQAGQGPSAVAARQASLTEDPANRRINGGGRVRFILHVIPISQPQIIPTSNGPAIAHSSDFSLVTPTKPAAPGETLSLFATGLGPTRPGVNPGQPFPASPLALTNSPIQVTVNGKQAQVIGAAGFPGAVDAYQVNFQLPSDTPKGIASVQVAAAWITGPSVNISVQ